MYGDTLTLAAPTLPDWLSLTHGADGTGYISGTPASGDAGAHFVELTGPDTSENQEAILGVITERDGRSWFVKMKGKASLVEQEKGNFEQFISSIKFHKATGDGHDE